MFPTPAAATAVRASRSTFDPRLQLRWIYVGRLSVASAIFIAALFTWSNDNADQTRIASLAFAITAVFTVASAGYSEIYRRPLGTTFLYGQAVFDLALVTAVVHVTTLHTQGAGAPAYSQFALLYILVIATSALLLPAGGCLLVATLGIVLYVAEVYTVQDAQDLYDTGLWFQLFDFAAVALGSAFVSAKLRRRGEASDILVVEHEQVRLRAEEVLRNIRSGVITVDAFGRLVYANPMAEQLLRVDLGALMGQPVLELIVQRAPELAAALEAAVHDQVRTQRGEGTISVDGRSFPVGVTTTYMEDHATGVRTASAIFQDISDHKRLETLRIRAGRLEGIAELSASLAHEIKNPLASIRSSVEQLGKMPTATADGRALSGLVMRESDRLSRLLSEFLDFARVRVAHADPVDVCEVVREAARLAGIHPDLGEGVRIVLALPDAPVMIAGDQDMLHRAVFNLTLNAIQASPPNTTVTIDVEPDGKEAAPFGMRMGGGAVVLRVTDRGVGIPAEYRDRLFDPFFTTKPQGGGLGLAVVHRAVEAHHGVVLVDTASGCTRFTVILPRTRPTAGRLSPIYS